MQELKREEKRKVIATGTVGIIIRESKEKNVTYYHLVDSEADKLDVYIYLGKFKIEDLDYTDEQKEEMWHENEEHGRQVNEENYYHYYNR